MPQPLYLMLLVCCEHLFSTFRKAIVQGTREVSSISHKMLDLRFPQTDQASFLLLWWSFGASGSSWWAFPCHKGNQCWFLEKPTSLLNTKRVTCAPIPIILRLSAQTLALVSLLLSTRCLLYSKWAS